jgi:hypothetical protein
MTFWHCPKCRTVVSAELNKPGLSSGWMCGCTMPGTLMTCTGDGLVFDCGDFMIRMVVPSWVL